MNEFILLVKEMRAAQSDYKKHMGYNPIQAKKSLSKQMRLEKEVDKKIIELMNNQQKLW